MRRSGRRADALTLPHIAERAARSAGALLLERFGRDAEGLATKSTKTDLVSDADRDAEALIRDLLARERPDDGLLAEEGSALEGSSGLRWVVDPLDGTVNYLYGIPHWAVSVAVEDDEGVIAGVVHDACRGETFTASRGGGSWLRPSVCDDLSLALIATGFGYDAARRIDQARVVSRLIGSVRDIRRAGTASLDLAWIACGRLDGYYERGLNHWDLAAGCLIVSESGGRVTRLAGEPPGVCASAPGIHNALLGALATAEGDG